MSKYFYPLLLKNEHLSQFKLADNIEIREMTPAEREEFFGLEYVDATLKPSPIGYVGFNRIMKSKTNKGRYSNTTSFDRGIFDGSSDILASNYVVIFDGYDSPDQIVQRFNLSLKLFTPTSSGCYLGFKSQETDVHFHFSMPVHGPYDYLSLDQIDLEVIQKYFNNMEDKWNTDKFRLLTDLFDRALQGGKTPLDVRFLLLAIALESLYLPKQDTEAQYRLCLRASKVLSKHGHGEAEEIFDMIKNIYKARSKLVHSGSTKDLSSNLFSNLTEVVRISLTHYIENPGDFTEEALANVVF